MKVSIGSKIVEGPWGGGNLFVKNLTSYLLKNGHSVVYDLSDSDIDLILLTDPRSRKESSSTFNHKEIKIYQKYINQNVSVVQRINECDERKGTTNINSFYLLASSCADKVVFVSSWLEKIYLKLGMNNDKTLVILSGSDKEIFKNYGNKTQTKKIKIVTHHWSSHKNKGFEIYSYLDELLISQNWKNKIEFTYIGNISSEFLLKNTKIIDPLDGENLAQELSKNDIYLTASINEPSGNHHIEGAMCGLPILYLNSGGIPEYCLEYGISFEGVEDFEDKLDLIIKNREKYLKKLENFQFTSENMNVQYLNLFENLVSKKKNISNKSNYFLKYLFLMKFKINKFFRKITPSIIFYKIKLKVKNVKK